MTLKTRSLGTVAAVSFFAFTATPTLAASEAEITAALQKSFAGAPGSTVELGSPSVSGDDFIYSPVTIKGGDGSETVIGTLTLTDADLNAGGGIKAGSIVGETINAKNGGSTIAIESIEILNPDFVPAPGADQPGKGRLDSLSANGISVTEEGKPPVTIASVLVETDDYVNDMPRSISVAIEGLEVDPASLDDTGEGAAQLKAYGYDKLTLGIFGAGSWDAAAGTLTFDELTVEGAEAGVITLSAVLGGVTEDVMAKLQQPSPPPELMQQITLQEAAVVYVDDSLAGRVLDVQAKSMGAAREAFVEQLTGALPLMLMALQNPGFQDQVATAVGAFLKDPKNLTISVAPEPPLSIMDIMMQSQMAPQTLPDTLKAEIEANADLDQQ